MAKGTEWQWAYLRQDIADPRTAATLRVKLPVNELISVIEVEWWAYLDSVSENLTEDCMGIDAVEKLEVIADGATILYSMSPHTASYIEYCRQKKMPAMDFYMCVKGPPKMRVKIMFGRYMRDPDFMLDTGQYKNVYLEVPYDITAAGYEAGEEFHYTIRYLRPIQRLSPVGFLRSRDIEYGAHDWALAGHHYVDLPLMYPWYRVGVRIWRPFELMHIDMPHIKLDIDDGRLVLVDDDLDDLRTIEDQRQHYPVTTSFHHIDTKDAAWRKLYCMMGYPNEAAFGLLDDENAGVLFLSGYGDECWVSIINDAEAMVSNSIFMTFRGENYMCCQTIKDWEDTEPFPVLEHSAARLDYTHAIVDMEDLRTFLTEICPLQIGGGR